MEKAGQKGGLAYNGFHFGFDPLWIWSTLDLILLQPSICTCRLWIIMCVLNNLCKEAMMRKYKVSNSKWPLLWKCVICLFCCGSALLGMQMSWGKYCTVKQYSIRTNCVWWDSCAQHKTANRLSGEKQRASRKMYCTPPKEVKRLVLFSSMQFKVGHNYFKPLTPRSDWHVASPFKIHSSSSKEIMRILKLIR